MKIDNDQNSRLEIVKRSHTHIWCDLAVKECDVCWAIRMLEEAQAIMLKIAGAVRVKAYSEVEGYIDEYFSDEV